MARVIRINVGELRLNHRKLFFDVPYSSVHGSQTVLKAIKSLDGVPTYFMQSIISSLHSTDVTKVGAATIYNAISYFVTALLIQLMRVVGKPI